MMEKLEILLLGTPQIRLNREPIESFRSNKARALLYFLAAERHPHSRQKLAGLLWTELSEERARANLRVELAKLPKILKPFLNISRLTVSFNTDVNTGVNIGMNHDIDIARFETLLSDSTPTLQALQEASELYQGRFLEDFYLQDAPAFEEWSLGEQERFQRIALQTLLKLVYAYTEEGAYERGLDCANRLLQLEPWREEGHRQLMLLLALSGQRGAALTQYDTCCRILVDELGVQPSAETDALYDQIESGKISSAQVDRTKQQTQQQDDHNRAFSAGPVGREAVHRPTQTGYLSLAPASPPHFVGRAEATETLCTWLTERMEDDAAPKSSALVGMGGMGKSALATHVAHHIRDQFPDGILWANVGISEPLNILNSWAQVYGFDLSGFTDVESCAVSLRGILSTKKVLIILDDVKNVASIRPLLPVSLRCPVLLTTRDIDIAVTVGARPYLVEGLSPEDSYQLLCKIVGVERVEKEADAAQKIAMLLQNMPLAMEITAQRLASRQRRKLVDMAQRLLDVQERLNLTMGDHAVRTSFMVSWESLDEALQRMFVYLAVFEGRSFTVDAIAYITDLDPYMAEEQLFSLAALSLLTEEPSERYCQHPLLADFAQEQLDKCDLQYSQDIRNRMATYYQEFAQNHSHDYTRLQPEWENLSAGLYTAHAQRRWILVLNYARALEDAWFVCAKYSVARAAYPLIQDAARALTDRAALGNCLYKWGEACIEQNEYEEAEQLLQQCIHLYQKLTDESAAADAQYLRAKIALEQSRFEEADSLFLYCQQIKEAYGDRSGISKALYGRARVLALKENHQDATSLCLDALNIQKEGKDLLGALQSYRLLAYISEGCKDYDAALSYGNEALSLCMELQEQRELAPTLYRLSMIYRKQKRTDLAQQYAEKSLTMFEKMGDQKLQGAALYSLSLIQEDRQEYQTSLDIGLRSLQFLRESKNRFGVVNLLMHLGDLHQQLYQPHEAHQVWSEALILCAKERHPSTQKLHRRIEKLGTMLNL